MSEASDFEKLKKKFEKLSSKYGEFKPRMKIHVIFVTFFSVLQRTTCS